VTDAGPRPAGSPQAGSPCPLCGEPTASTARISTFRRGEPATVVVVECRDCGIFVFHESTLADGPLTPDELRRLRAAIHHGSLYNTPCDVTRDLVAKVRAELEAEGEPPEV